MKRVIAISVALVFLLGILNIPLAVPYVFNNNQDNDVSRESPESLEIFSEGPLDRVIRVAVYDEPNITVPSYSMNYQRSYSITGVVTLLESTGHDVTLLTFQDILDHKLCTRDFDVFVMPNNNPRENITNLVKEFWLGGGGLLSFNAALSYLFYFGMLGPEFEGTDPYTVYWADAYEYDELDVASRHPVTKDYQINDTISRENEWVTVFARTAWEDESSIIKDDVTILLHNKSDPFMCLGCAVDNIYRGGRVVHLPIDHHPIPSGMESVIVNAVDWLAPRPKGRIVFDYTRETTHGVDSWDDLAFFPGELYQFRELLVNHTYTFDKLYPSPSGNLTGTRLQGYDILICYMPKDEYTTSEITAVQNFISDRGGLIAFGADPINAPMQIDYINTLTEVAGISINESAWTNTAPIYPMQYFTLEGCANLDMDIMRGYVNVSGYGVGLWGDWPEFHIGSTFYGGGRIVVSAENRWVIDSHIPNSDNARFVLNLANWLTASNADVLVFQDLTVPFGENDYRSGICTALNELGIRFMLHLQPYYFNLSLFWNTWDLIIIDSNAELLTPYYDLLQTHLESDGKLIMTSHYFYHSNESVSGNLNFHNYLGFEGIDEYQWMGAPVVYTWDHSHSIFYLPIDYASWNFTTTSDFVVTDYSSVSLFSNATPLAGITQTQEENKSAIVESVNGRALLNFFAVAEFTDDTDDSTYPDNYELWINEIAYMMRPTIDSQPDKVIEYGSIGETITWYPYSDRPFEYGFAFAGEFPFEEGPWYGDSITLSLDELPIGSHNIIARVVDSSGYAAGDSVIVTVVDTTYPAFVDGPDNLNYQEGTEVHLLNWSYTELNPDAWALYINGTLHDSGYWDGSMISADAGGLTEGVYNATIAVNDTSGLISTSTVTLTVTAPSTTTTSTTTTTTTTDTTTDTGTTTPPPDDGENTMLIVMAAVAGLVVIGIVVVMMRRKKS